MEVNWVEISLNAFISFVVAIGVALYIRLNVKPTHEIVFEHNRSEEIRRVFLVLNRVNLHFENFLNHLEDNMGEITKERQHLIPKPEFKLQSDGSQMAEISPESVQLRERFEQIRNSLVFDVQQISNSVDAFEKDYLRLLSSLENSFIQDVWQYVWHTKYYSEWATKEYLQNNLLESRKNEARRIIEFVKDDKSINIDDPNIKEFIIKWEPYI